MAIRGSDVAPSSSNETLADETPRDRQKRVDPVTQDDYLLSGALAVVFYLVGLFRLGTPGQQFFDEVYHARTGMQYVLGQDPTEWTHPPLTKLLIALSLKLWHVNFNPADGVWNENTVYPYHSAFAWRYPSLLFGSFALVIFYMLARTMFGRRDMAFSAACLLALDGAFFVQSRVAMTNIFTVCFVLVSALGTYRLLTTNRLPNLFLTGLGIGLALATRWTAMYVWGLTWIALLWHLFFVLIPLWRDQAYERDQSVSWSAILPQLAKWVLLTIVCLFGIPLLLYVVVYIPNVLQGPGDWKAKLLTWHGLGGSQSWAWNLGIKDGLQHNMWTYHAGIKDKHPYSSPWWSWPAMIRPVWYYDHTDPDKRLTYIYCIGNGLIWWASVPALIAAAYVGFRERRVALSLVALLGLGQWLLWGIEPRSLVFMHYFFESIPYAVLAITFFAWRIWECAPDAFRWAAPIYALLAIGWAIFYYPILTAYPVSQQYLQLHWTGTQDWVPH